MRPPFSDTTASASGRHASRCSTVVVRAPALAVKIGQLIPTLRLGFKQQVYTLGRLNLVLSMSKMLAWRASNIPVSSRETHQVHAFS